MARGLDYSFSHPDLNCARQQGYTFVARYVGDLDPNSLKYLDAPELVNIRAAGHSVCVVYETTAGFIFTADGGVVARQARTHCDQLGLFGIPIYYALDVDPRALDDFWKGVVREFFRDAAAADGGGSNVGIYGSDDALDWFMSSNCQWGWQTYAWSTGRISPNAHFRQYLNGQSICGGTVDLNETYALDFGQWPRPTQGEWFDMDKQEFFAAMTEYFETVNIVPNLVTSDPADAMPQAVALGFIHEATYWNLINGLSKPVICATNENPTLWYMVGPGLYKAGPFNAVECEDLVRGEVASFHWTTDPTWRPFMIPQWVMDDCHLYHEHIPIPS